MVEILLLTIGMTVYLVFCICYAYDWIQIISKDPNSDK